MSKLDYEPKRPPEPRRVPVAAFIFAVIVLLPLACCLLVVLDLLIFGVD